MHLSVYLVWYQRADNKQICHLLLRVYQLPLILDQATLPLTRIVLILPLNPYQKAHFHTIPDEPWEWIQIYFFRPRLKSDQFLVQLGV